MNKINYIPKHAVFNSDINKNFWIITLKCIAWVLLGAAAGYISFYFFKDFSVNLISKYKFIQGIFGMSQYEEGTSYIAVLLTVLSGNLISTIAYFGLGYFRLLIPLSVITGFLMTMLLFTGSVLHNTAIPPEVVILFSAEAFYRCLALSAGEHFYKNKLEKKRVLIISIVTILLILLATAFYEIYQIYGYIF